MFDNTYVGVDNSSPGLDPRSGRRKAFIVGPCCPSVSLFQEGEDIPESQNSCFLFQQQTPVIWITFWDNAIDL